MLVSVGKYTIHGYYGMSLLEGQVNHFFFWGGILVLSPESLQLKKKEAIPRKLAPYLKYKNSRGP